MSGSTLYFRVFGAGCGFLSTCPFVQARMLSTSLRNESRRVYLRTSSMSPIRPHQATSKKRKNTGESSVLQHIQKFTDGAGLARMRAAGVLVGIGDDAAIWRPRSGYETVLTTDWFLEGTHFLPRRHTPAMIAHKCLARAVSDVAAMGGEPRCLLLS